MAMLYGYRAGGRWEDRREANRLDGGAHFYDSYCCADGKWVAVGAIEPQFYRELITRLGLDPDELGDAADHSRLPALKQKIGEQLVTKSGDEWCRLLEPFRSEEHTYELHSLMRISYAVFCVTK